MEPSYSIKLRIGRFFLGIWIPRVAYAKGWFIAREGDRSFRVLFNWSKKVD